MGKEFTQIHIVPFDIGLAFIDVLAVDNTRNLMLAQKFIQVLSARVSAIDPEIQVCDNLKVSFSDNKAVKYSFKTKDVAENAICYVKLMPNLYCYILSSGIGVFVLVDAGGEVQGATFTCKYLRAA